MTAKKPKRRAGAPAPPPPPMTVLPNSRVTPRFAGICTFCRCPRLEDVAAANRPVGWAIYGVPFDAGTTYHPGARFGPRAVREQSQYVKRYSIAHGVDPFAVMSVADAGDSPVNIYSCEENVQTQFEFASSLGDGGAGMRLMAVGGDHSIAYANIKATWERNGKPRGGLALLHFDSHLDTVDAVWGERWGHASVFRRAIEDGLVDPGRTLSVGVKGPLNTAEDLEFARQHGLTVMTYDDVQGAGGVGTLAKPGGGAVRVAAFVKKLKDAPAYITFDVDCVDPAFAPGTGTPSVGGFTSAEALGLVRSLRGVNVVGADVVEVLPERDVGGITALLAGHLVYEILCLDAVRR